MVCFVFMLILFLNHLSACYVLHLFSLVHCAILQSAYLVTYWINVAENILKNEVIKHCSCQINSSRLWNCLACVQLLSTRSHLPIFASLTAAETVINGAHWFLFHSCCKLGCLSAQSHNTISIILWAMTFSTVIAYCCFLSLNKVNHSLISSKTVFSCVHPFLFSIWLTETAS